jgi:hypothetical protein
VNRLSGNDDHVVTQQVIQWKQFTKPSADARNDSGIHQSGNSPCKGKNHSGLLQNLQIPKELPRLIRPKTTGAYGPLGFPQQVISKDRQENTIKGTIKLGDQ